MEPKELIIYKDDETLMTKEEFETISEEELLKDWDFEDYSDFDDSIKRYSRRYKDEEDEDEDMEKSVYGDFLVERGDKLYYKPDDEYYIVAAVDDDKYILICTEDGCYVEDAFETELDSMYLSDLIKSKDACRLEGWIKKNG